MARLDLPTLVIDLDPANRLGMLLGAGAGPAHGVASAILGRRSLAESALITSDDVRFIGFGRSTAEDRTALEATLAEHPGWLANELQRIELPAETVVFCDTPRRPSSLADQACHAADGIVDILALTAAAYAGLRELSPTPALVHILNGFDATRTLHTDLRALLADELGDHLAPYAVHRDEAVAEAAASDSTVLDFVRGSQAVRDIQALARWLTREWKPV